MPDVPTEVRMMHFSATLGFLANYVKKGFVVFLAAKIAGMQDEEASCLPELFKASGCSLVKGGTMGVKVLSLELRCRGYPCHVG